MIVEPRPPHRESRDLIPNGYENMLRALGFELDQRIAENVVITELPSFIAVSGFEPVLGYGEASFRPFSEPLAPPDIINMLRTGDRSPRQLPAYSELHPS